MTVVDEPLTAVEIKVTDTDTGGCVSYGVLAARRTVGRWELRITYDKARRTWWIITDLFAHGWDDWHREDAWNTFLNSTEQDVDIMYGDGT